MIMLCCVFLVVEDNCEAVFRHNRLNSGNEYHASRIVSAFANIGIILTPISLTQSLVWLLVNALTQLACRRETR